jgi:adenine-specific DNA methylase
MPSDEERAFSAELERFERLRAFTEQLIAKREAEAFEQATLRQARIAKLKRELTEREAAMSEREFDDALTLYLKKRELTRELAVRAKASATGSTSMPRTTPSP